MRAGDAVLLTILAGIWGMSYVFIRVASPAIGPAVLMEIRFAASAAAVLTAGWASGALRPFLRDLRVDPRRYAVIGVLSAALPTTLIGWAELRLTASVATVLNSLVPFFAAGAATRWLAEPWTRRLVTGLALGLGGVIALVGGGSVALVPLSLLAAGASLAAAASYGVGSVYVRRRFQGTPGLWEAMGMMLVAAFVLAPVAAVTTAAPDWTPQVVGATLGLTALSTAVAYLLYFRLIARVGATQTTTVTFLSPIFGVLGGHFLLGEPLELGLVVGTALILAGVALVIRSPAPSSPPAPEATPGEGTR